MSELDNFLQDVSSEYVAKYDHSKETKDYPMLSYGYNYILYWLKNNDYSEENLNLIKASLGL